MSLTLVTGASGHLGANLVRELLARGRSVRVLVRDDVRAIEGLDVERVRGDVVDRESLDRAVEGADVVHHLAARISIVRYDEVRVRAVNLDGTRNVVDACRRAGVRRLVHFGSIHAYESVGVIDEDTPLVTSPDHPPYDRSKADAERLVRAAAQDGLDAIIVSPTAVIGPHDYKPSFTGRALWSMWTGAIPALTAGGYDWVDARDVVRGALAAEERAAPGSRYLLSGTWLSVREMAELVHRVGGKKPPRLVAPLWLAAIGAPFAEAWGRVRGHEPIYTPTSLRALRSHRHISRARAERELGYAPRPLEETVRDALRWRARAEGA